jgi:hypothetical protein
MERVLARQHFSWGVMLHANMVGQLYRCRVVDSGEFSFGLILVAWFWRGCLCCARECCWVNLVCKSRDCGGGQRFWFSMGVGMVATISRLRLHRCGFRCHRLYYGTHTSRWNSGMILRWCYLQERCLITEVWCDIVIL